MTNEVMTIREMCEAFDVTPRTLRFYESKELLFPVREGQKRLFTHRDRARLKLIMRGKKFGFSLEDIRQLLDMYSVHDDGEAQLRATLEAYLGRLSELQAERDRLNAVIGDLESEMGWVENELEQKNSLGRAS